MLNTYIKNRGTSKTIIHDNNNNRVNELNWDVDYDGDTANISVDTDYNGKTDHFDIKLDNNDLANILNMQSVNMPINKRLQMDFNDNINYDPRSYYMELPTPELMPIEPQMYVRPIVMDKLIDRRISSPKSNEIFLPLNNLTKHTMTPKKKHKRRKTHVTHKIYKKTKSSRSKRSKSKSNL
jgi:hypothetical protein